MLKMLYKHFKNSKRYHNVLLNIIGTVRKHFDNIFCWIYIDLTLQKTCLKLLFNIAKNIQNIDQERYSDVLPNVVWNVFLQHIHYVRVNHTTLSLVSVIPI